MLVGLAHVPGQATAITPSSLRVPFRLVITTFHLLAHVSVVPTSGDTDGGVVTYFVRVMTDSIGDGRARDVSDEDLCANNSSRFLPSLGCEAIDIYQPQAILDALLHYRGARSVHTVQLAADPQSGTPNQNASKNAAKPPRFTAGSKQEGAPAEGQQDEPPPQLTRAPRRAAAGADTVSICIFCGELQEALLEGLGFLDQELRSRNVSRVHRLVMEGRAVYHSEGKSSFGVWASSVKQGVAFFCSCGADALSENVSARTRMGASSTCWHEVALALALHGVARHVLSPSVADLLRRYGALDNANADSTNVVTVEVVADKDGRKVHSVGYSRIWCVVNTPPDRIRRGTPVCTHIPCRSRNTYCVHSCSVKAPMAGYGGFNDASASDGDDAGTEGEGEASNKGRASVSTQTSSKERPPVPNWRRIRDKRDFIDTDYPPRARNMLPCGKETELCRPWDKIARGEAPLESVAHDLIEARCTSCGAATSAMGPGTSAEL